MGDMALAVEFLALKEEVLKLREFNQRLMAELAQHGWGDFHYGATPQEPSIVALLKEGGFGSYGETININEEPNSFERDPAPGTPRGDVHTTNTQTPSGTDATPDASDRGSGEWEDTMGRRGSGEVPDGAWLLRRFGKSG